jgi:hypothetical protein
VIITDADEQQVDGVEAAVGLTVGATSLGLLQLGERAGFLIGELAGTADAAILTASNDRMSLLCGVSAIIFDKRSDPFSIRIAEISAGVSVAVLHAPVQRAVRLRP